MKKPFILFLTLLCLLLSTCQQAPPPDPEENTVGNIPIIASATELGPTEIPIALRFIEQAHKETIDKVVKSHFHVDKEFIDTIEWYDDEFQRYGWKLIDVLEFGDGGFLRRYYRNQQRAIVAFHPGEDENSTDFMLMQGELP